MNKPIGIIYVTTNLINHKKYIGQHLGFDKTYLGSGTILKKAINKYGRENFKRETLCECYSKTEMDHKERLFIALYDATNSNAFYNLHEGGLGGNTMQGWSKERKAEFIEKMKVINSGENNGMLGKKHSEETLKLLGELATERDQTPYRTEEFKNKMSIVTSGEQNGMSGKSHSAESIQLMKDNREPKYGSSNGNFGNIGDSAKNGKAVLQYSDKECLNLINRFNTLTLTLNYLEIKGHSALYRAIKNERCYKGYYWRKESKV